MGIRTKKIVVATIIALVAYFGIDKTGILVSRDREYPINMVIIHDTVGNTVKGAEDTLVQRGLGYHFVIDKEGKVYNYVFPSDITFHALGWNERTIGIATVGGGPYGLVNDKQRLAIINLLIQLKKAYPSIKYLCGHRDVSPGRKIDPEVLGDYKTWMNAIAKEVGLRYLDKDNVKIAKGNY